MKKTQVLIGAVALAGIGGWWYFHKSSTTMEHAVLEEEMAQTASDKSANGSDPEKDSSGSPQGKSAKKSTGSLKNLDSLGAERRMDEVSAWSSQLKKSASREEGSRMVREGLKAYKKLDTPSKALLRMTFCMAMLNRDEPEAIKFVENTARMNQNNPNVLTNLLQGMDAGKAAARYPGLTRIATSWFMANKEIRYDDKSSAFISSDPGVMKGIEGSKFVTYDVEQMRKQLTRIRAI
jgi:hypothetical protein